MFTLPRLYAIADQDSLDRRHLLLREFAEQLAEAGVRLLQYRNKSGSPQDILAGAALISEVFRGVECTLVMNDRADLAVLAGWRAVHVGQGDLPPAAARRVLGDTPGVGQSLVGLSTHTDEEVRSANLAGPDYIAVGPVFATGTKPDAEPVVGLEGVRRARSLTARPLVAIGGITRENARSVLDAGADSVAVIGGLLAPGDDAGIHAAQLLKLLG